MTETQQGVAQRVMEQGARDVDGSLLGAQRLHRELSAEARAVLAEMDADIQQILSGDDELERDYQDIDSIELEQSLIRRFSKRLGFDLEGEDS